MKIEKNIKQKSWEKSVIQTLCTAELLESNIVKNPLS